MKHRILIITADKTLPRWRTLPAKLRTIRAELQTMRNADFSIDIEYRDLTPAVHKGRVTSEWMDGITGPAHRAGFDFVGFHMSAKQAKAWGVEPRGKYFEDLDIVHEFFFWADERTKRQGRDQFIQTCLHELRHGIVRGMGFPDDTHAVHADGDIRGSFRHLDMGRYEPQARYNEKVSLVARLKALLSNMTLFQAATKFLGTDASPQDVAPDMLGCAESVSMVIREVIPAFPILPGTWTLWKAMEKHPRFRQVTIPMPGTVIISPTGTGKGKVVPNGHVGIVGEGGRIMSNNSYTGLWEYTHTPTAWQKYYGDKGGYPTYYFQLIK